MNDLRKAAEMALERLESHDYWMDEEAIQALRQALAHEALDRMVAENQKMGLYDDAIDEQEPVDWEAVAADQAMTIAMMQIENKREWVGLTDDEFQACFDHGDGTLGSLMYAIEAKLKEKNVPQP